MTNKQVAEILLEKPNNKFFSYNGFEVMEVQKEQIIHNAENETQLNQ